ncbi:MAG: hypothetical protein ACI4UL_00025 [Muribaculaceae bacterium]
MEGVGGCFEDINYCHILLTTIKTAAKAVGYGCASDYNRCSLD